MYSVGWFLWFEYLHPGWFQAYQYDTTCPGEPHQPAPAHCCPWPHWQPFHHSAPGSSMVCIHRGTIVGCWVMKERGMSHTSVRGLFPITLFRNTYHIWEMGHRGTLTYLLERESAVNKEVWTKIWYMELWIGGVQRMPLTLQVHPITHEPLMLVLFWTWLRKWVMQLSHGRVSSQEKQVQRSWGECLLIPSLLCASYGPWPFKSGLTFGSSGLIVYTLIRGWAPGGCNSLICLCISSDKQDASHLIRV